MKLTQRHSTWPSFGEWEEIDDNGTERRVTLDGDYDPAMTFDDNPDAYDWCSMFVEVRRGTLTPGWTGLCGISTDKHANWHEVCDYLDLILDELTEEAIANMIANTLGSFA